MFAHYSRNERIADHTVHIVGLLAGTVAVAILLTTAIPQGHTLLTASLITYSGGLMAMLSASALYHMVSHGRWKQWLRRLDHAAIFGMIGGTYTPFLAIKFHGAWSVALLAYVWSVAAVGGALALICPRRTQRFETILYLCLGWTVLLALGPLFATVSTLGIALLTIGGLLYSIGIVFHLWRRLPYHNVIWHALVVVAASCHYAAILGDIALPGVRV